MYHYFFLSLHLLHFVSLPLASVLCPGFARLVPVAHHSALPVSYCYSALPCPIHVSHLPLVIIVHSGCSRCCLFSLSFSFCLILLSVSVLFCTPSVGWLRSTLVVFFSVCVHSLCIAAVCYLLISLSCGPSLTVHRLHRVSCV